MVLTRAAAALALVAGTLVVDAANVCSIETGTCECHEAAAAKRVRCEGIKPVFEGAGSHCMHYHSDSATCEA